MSKATARDDGGLGLQGIHHFGIVVENLDRAIEWYQRVLGFELEARWATDDGSVSFAHVAGHAVRFELFETRGARPGPDEGADVFGALATRGAKHVGLQVVDIEAAARELGAKGVEIILGPNDVSQAGVRNLFVRDVDGNQIELVQWARTGG